ncbi:hypothetical protein ACFPFV_08110 [Salinicoccus siamensis]
MGYPSLLVIAVLREFIIELAGKCLDGRNDDPDGEENTPNKTPNLLP